MNIPQFWAWGPLLLGKDSRASHRGRRAGVLFFGDTESCRKRDAKDAKEKQKDHGDKSGSETSFNANLPISLRALQLADTGVKAR
jgi:hypothetical protein